MIIHDNFKTIWGPKDVDCQGKIFGVRVVKRGRPVVEAGMRVVPFPNVPPYVVVGTLIQKLNRKTNILIVVMNANKQELGTLDLTSVEKLSPDQILDPTDEARNIAKEGRRLLCRYARSSAAMPVISEPESTRSERNTPKRKRAREPSLCKHSQLFNVPISPQSSG